MSYVVKVKVDGKEEPEEKRVIVKKPSTQIKADAAVYANKVFTKLINMKDDSGDPIYMLRVNMDQCLSDRGVWTESIANRLIEVSQEIVELEDKIYKGGISKKEGREIAIKLKELRIEQINILADRNKYDENTVEGQADNEKFHYFITKCVLYEDDSPVFNTIEDYKNDNELSDQLHEAISELGSLVSNFDPDFEKKLPENRFLTKYGFCNEDLRYIDEQGRFVDRDGKLVDKDGNYIDEDGKILENTSSLEKEIGEFVD